MQDKSSDSQALGICQRLFYFFMDNLMARGLKRVTFHKPTADDPNSDIRIQFKQTEGQIIGSDQIPDISRTKGKIEKIIERDMETPLENGVEANYNIKLDPRPRESKKKDAAADEDKITEKRKGVILTSDKLDNIAEIGQSRVSDKLKLLVVQPEELNVARSPRLIKPVLLDVAKNINEKSDAFIRSKKEKMRITSLEGNKKR